MGETGGEYSARRQFRPARARLVLHAGTPVISVGLAGGLLASRADDVGDGDEFVAEDIVQIGRVAFE
ncbi:hypothetical protein J2S49_001361 [Arcanobacterium wilhelmae]|uniref:Uncharacterized protein n=1 Tax=Arcanobacterium wilhelmae TaxID=1803177 RepID=A0ABT9NCQ3_9ACTO|nr:hypothetical protein [Arcanobacterium wilhelmae]